MKNNLTNKTVSELASQKESWLREYESFLYDLARSVWEIGEHHNEHSREIASVRQFDLFFVVNQSADLVDPKRNAPIVKYFLSVSKGGQNWYSGYQIAFFATFEDVSAYGICDTGQQNFVVPGDWMQLATAVIAECKQREQIKHAEEEEKERQWLLKKLLNGIDV